MQEASQQCEEEQQRREQRRHDQERAIDGAEQLAPVRGIHAALDAVAQRGIAKHDERTEMNADARLRTS